MLQTVSDDPMYSQNDMWKFSVRAKTILIAAVVAVATAGAISISYRLGSEHGSRNGATEGQGSLERLQLIWPDFLQLPDNDRLILAYLSVRCELHKESLVPRSIVRCLSRAAAAEEADPTRSSSGKERAALKRLLPNQYTEFATEAH